MNKQPNTTQEAGGKARCDKEELVVNKYFENLLRLLYSKNSIAMVLYFLASWACVR